MPEFTLKPHLNALNKLKISLELEKEINENSDRVKNLNTVIAVYERLYKKDTIKLYDFTPIEVR
jgi:hypothetical protein